MTHTLRRGIVLNVAASIVLFIAQSPVLAAGAPRTVHMIDVIDYSGVETYLSGACGFEVMLTGEDVFLDETLRYNDQGLVVSETDTFGGGKWTYSTGNGSFTETEAEVGHYDYPGGASIGFPIIGTLSGSGGLFLHVTAFAPSLAGQLFFTGTVTGFDSNGIPQGVYSVYDSRGNPVDFGTLLDGFCAALSGAKPGVGR
jgi:hypothetical protein